MWPASNRWRDLPYWPLLALLGIAAAALVVEVPAIAVGISVLPFIILTGPGRIFFVVVGGLTALGTSNELDMLKLAYLGGVAAISLVAAIRYAALSQVHRAVMQSPLVPASLILGGYFGFSILWGVIGGNDIINAIRDAAPYGLFALVPLLALDAALSPWKRLIGGVFLALGALATVIYPLYWAERRELVTLGFSFLPAVGSLPIAFFAFLCAGSIIGKWRWLWGAAAGLALVLLMLSGNRTILVVILGPLFMILVSKGDRLSRSLRLLLSGTALVLVAVFGFAVLGIQLGVDPALVADRLTPPRTIDAALGDQSLDTRLSQSAVAVKEFMGRPLFGTGAGYMFVWVNPITGEAIQSFTMDTPMVYPAKYGIVGIALFLFLVGHYAKLFTRLSRFSIAGLALIGYSLVEFVNMLLLGSPIENKGFTFGFLLLLSLSLNDMAGTGRRNIRSLAVGASFTGDNARIGLRDEH